MLTGANSSIVSPKIGSFGKNSLEFEKTQWDFAKKLKIFKEKTQWNFKKLNFWLQFVAAQSQKTLKGKACIIHFVRKSGFFFVHFRKNSGPKKTQVSQKTQVFLTKTQVYVIFQLPHFRYW